MILLFSSVWWTDGQLGQGLEGTNHLELVRSSNSTTGVGDSRVNSVICGNGLIRASVIYLEQRLPASSVELQRLASYRWHQKENTTLRRLDYNFTLYCESFFTLHSSLFPLFSS